MRKFAENLKARRTALGLTQEALAEKIHVTRQAVSNWETGKTQPDLEMLALLSWALEVDVSTLLGDRLRPGAGGISGGRCGLPRPWRRRCWPTASPSPICQIW